MGRALSRQEREDLMALQVTRSIRQALAMTGASQRDVAVALDVSPQTVSAWVKGRKLPSLLTFLHLVDYLGSRGTRLEGL